MAAHEVRKHQLGVGTRLAHAPSAALVASFGNELRYAHVLYEGLSYADLAHTLMLIEQAIIPAADGRVLLEALVALHDGGLAAVRLDAKWGDIYNNRDAELERRIGKPAGWLHAGRARREALTLAWLIHLRSGCHDLVGQAAALVRTIADVAEQHAGALMPDFTYLQHAHPTTLGHFLLGFAYPVLRDTQRLADTLRYINSCPAGSASTNGSRLPLNRERLCELLGFAELIVHNRDAMWQSDLPINLMSVLVSFATTADRLVEELQIWATAEFGFVELADQHCRTSVIMPNKKNPYVLSFIRGKARELGGQLMSVIATNQTPSGQLDNRNAAYELVPAALSTVQGLLTLLSEVLGAAQFKTARLRQQADSGFTWATELADLLLQREGVDARAAHEIVGAVVAQQCTDQPPPLAASIAGCFRAATGQPIHGPAADLIPELNAERIVATRTALGGCAPDAVRQMTASLREAMEQVVVHNDAAKVATFPALLRGCVSEQLGRTW